MQTTVEFEQFCFRLCNTALQPYPFPHFFARNVFSSDIYGQLLKALPLDSEYKSHEASDYNGRRFADIAPTFPFHDLLLSRQFTKRIVRMFGAHFPKFEGNVVPELRLIRDGQHYFIGPHTDAPWKLISLLFYLPPSDPNVPPLDIGTSFYTPKNPAFRCPGGPHHSFDDFHRIHTLPFEPNSCLGFLKTDQSFHGVEPIDRPVQRDVLLWNLYSVPTEEKSDEKLA